MTEQLLRFYTSPSEEETARRFFELYEPYRAIICPDMPLPIKVPTRERVCRFCRRKFPFAKFKTSAHVIPECLGNRYLTSDFECDECNHLFGELDDQLANFVGVQRSLNGIVGKNSKKVKFHSGDKRITVSQEPFYSDPNAIKIQLSKSGNGAVTYDKGTSEFCINFLKRSYKPLLVYQSLIKIALSVIPSEDLLFYEKLIKFILTDKKRTIYKIRGAMLSGYFCPIFSGEPKPYVFLFRKKNSEINIPTHVSVLYCKNMMLEVKLPLHCQDRFNETREEIKVMDCPPLFLRPYEQHYTPYKHFRRDLSSSELMKTDEEQMRFRLDFSNGLTQYNPKTGIIQDANLNANTIKELWISSAKITLK